LGIGLFFFLKQEKHSTAVTSQNHSASEIYMDEKKEGNKPIDVAGTDIESEKSTNASALSAPNIEHTQDAPIEAKEFAEVPKTKADSFSKKYIDLAKKALGDKFSPPQDVSPKVTQENGFVVVTYPFEPIIKNGVPLPGPEYHAQVKFDAKTDEVVSIQAGS